MKKTKKKLWISISIVAAIVVGIVLLIVLIPGSEWEDKKISKNKVTANYIDEAETYLLNNSYNVSIAALTGSTDSSVESTSASVYITVDGENYSYSERLGDAQITYLFVDGVFYVNEDFIGIITKEPLDATDSAVEKNYKKYVSDYANSFSLDDYVGFTSSRKDGVTTIKSTGFSADVAVQRSKEMAELLEGNEGVASVAVDTTRSKITLKFDEQGRYSSITIIDATVITYKDGTQDLVRNTYSRNYTYENSKLVTPSDAANYIGMNSGYKDLFKQSFTVTTTVSATSSMDLITASLLGSAFGIESVVKVDGNNLKYEFGKNSETGNPIYVETLICDSTLGDRLYVYDASYGETDLALYYSPLAEADFDAKYYERAVSQYIPTLARGFNEISISDGVDGRRTVTCRYLSEDYFYSLYEHLNPLGSSASVIVPSEDGCTYTVVIDENGRYVRSEILITVKTCTVSSGTLVENATYTYKVTRTFDYTEADAFYKDAAEGAHWIVAPEDADKYSPMPEYY